jgi:hypothetical protein
VRTTGLEGQRLVGGRYRLAERLGAGGMGTVWRAEDTLLGRPVAVKEVVFPPGTRPKEAEVLRERTRREARAAARLDHPSAVTVYDVVEEDGRPWLVLELVEARSLADVVAADGPLSPRRTAEVGLALLGALDAAHAKGIVHRDVKPGNVLLTEHGRVVLTDFGIATSAGDSALTSSGLLLGSPAYIAPERARGQSPGAASDLWSLGATLYTAVEGRPAYDGGDPLRTVTAVVTGRPAPYSLAGPLVPVLDGLLSNDPAQRLEAGPARTLLQRVAAQPREEPATALLRPVGAPAEDRTAALHVEDLPAAVRTPAGTRGPRRRGRVAALRLAALCLAALAALGVGAVSVLQPDAPRTSAAAPATATAPAPAGWTTYTDPAGWTAAVPPGWVRSTYRGQVQFRDEARRRTLRVDVVPASAGGAVAAWRTASPSYAKALDDYRELSVEQVDYRGLDAADLEFTYTSQATALHVLDRTVVSGSTAYVLYWQTGAADFPASLPVFEQVAASFRLS